MFLLNQENNLISLRTHIFRVSREHHETISIKTAVITVSTTRTEKTDLSGKILQEIFEAAGIPVIGVKIVKDDITEIRSAVIDALKSANCIIVNGGTGLTYDDCTIEAVSPPYQNHGWIWRIVPSKKLRSGWNLCHSFSCCRRHK